MTDLAINTNSLFKASLQRLLAELEFLHANGLVTDEAHATIQQGLARSREKLQIVKFVVTCAFAHTKKGEAELEVAKGQVLEVLDDHNKHWFMGRVRGGDGKVGWAPKNKFRTGE
ncbi:hypothetical protein FN846DRAFT_920243 [Sphaerosporella brunnea]|uniref:SH3 domain-containing protein n=1 Tax=Sphaerosporella brunnea TaxID=1250544 RepID=A0A5J5ESK9_9PEZI|nr:hypothetical protein FN846DRAFT_920243 [Sphaerosporella brunnea]